MDVKIVLFCVFGYVAFVSSSSNEPKLYINNRQQLKLEYITDSNANFTVVCEGTKPVTWTFENNTNNDEMFKKYSTILITENPISKGEYKYASILNLVNASFVDTGMYTCQEVNTDLKSKRIKELYLYVRDEENLSASATQLITIRTTFSTNIIIPCRPTSPDVTVTLFNSYDETEIIAKYNRLVGFTFVSAPHHPEEYTCSFKRFNSQGELIEVENFILLLNTPKSTFINKPNIIDEKMGHTIVGDTLELKCSLVFAYHLLGFQMSWSGPYIGREKNRLTVSNLTSDTTIHYKKFRLSNVTKADEGNYTCMVVDDDGNANNNTLFVKVYDINEHYINLTEENDVYTINCKAGDPYVQWSIDINAHPIDNLNLTWLNNKNEIIELSDMKMKYEINTTKTETVLKIKTIAITDFGNYTLMAKSQFEEKELKLFLNVTDKPSVHIESSDFHFYGNKSLIKCIVAAYPEPTIQWKFRKCENTAKCPYANVKANSTYRNGLQIISTIELLAEKTGLVMCTANNSLGSDTAEVAFYVTDIENGFSVWTSNNVIKKDNVNIVAVGDTVELVCAASVYNYTKNVNWYRDNEIIRSNDDYVIDTGYTDFSYKVKLTLLNASKNDSGDYTCRVAEMSGPFKDINITLAVLKPNLPTLHKTNFNESLSMLLPDELKLECIFSGIPKPEITWYKDGVIIHGDNRTYFENFNQIMRFRRTRESDEGTYTCLARNKVGLKKRSMKLTFHNKQSHKLMIIVVLCLSVLLICCLGLLIFKIRKEKKLRYELRKAGLENFEEGRIESLNPELELGDQAELLPYDRKWEFPREKIKLGKQLGSGAFGVVMKAEAEGIVEGEDSTTVAVKMVKRNADHMYTRALVSELKIMVHLGKHLNVVNLLGACTKNIVKRELLVIVEFCRYGNLHNYLIRHRENFIDQIDKSTGKINTSIDEIRERTFSNASSRSNSSSSKIPNLKYLALSFSKNSGGEGGHVNNLMADYRGINYTGNTTNTETTTVNMSPNGASDDVGVTSNGSLQPQWRSNYRGDYKGHVQPICTKDLLTWAFQVARAMEYLASRKVLHGDLAARNILLADNNIVKICDFGLAKSMYKNDNYKKKGDGPMPIKWMAIESIGDRIFSTQSDVWSFGIVLWEFFSLARTPYPGMEADEKLYHNLRNGHRMEAPQYATKEIYRMMRDCWEFNPLNRPTFSQLSARIGYMLEETVRQYYIDLNDPYLVMNTGRLDGGESDYLSMFTPPDFENLSSPLQYANEPMAENNPNGYMCMKPGNIFSPRETGDDMAFTFDIPKKRTESESGAVVELMPMLNMQTSQESDSEAISPNPVDTNSFSNPSYHMMTKPQDDKDIVKSSDNYVNMPKNKSAIMNNVNNQKEEQTPDKPYVNNMSRDWERINY